MEASSANSFVGDGSVYVSEREAAWQGVTKHLKSNMFKPGNSYSFSANVMYDDGGLSDTFYMKLQYVNSEGQVQYSTVAEAVAVKGSWVQLLNESYQIPEDASDIYLYVETGDSTNSFYLDEVIGAVDGTGILGAGPGKNVVAGDLNFDNKINCFDVCIAMRGIGGEFDDGYVKLAADVNEDGKVDISDVQLIRDFTLRRVTVFKDSADDM